MLTSYRLTQKKADLIFAQIEQFCDCQGAFGPTASRVHLEKNEVKSSTLLEYVNLTIPTIMTFVVKKKYLYVINVIRIIVQIQIYQTQAYQFFSQENLKPLKTPQPNHTFFFFLSLFRKSQSQ